MDGTTATIGHKLTELGQRLLWPMVCKSHQPSAYSIAEEFQLCIGPSDAT